MSKRKGICFCKCEKCGGTFKNKYKNLKNTPKCKLCSSGKSMGEITVSNILIHFKVNFDTEKTFKGLKGVNGGKLRFDFIINHNNRKFIIEVDGNQHRQECGTWAGNTKKHDVIKNNFCKENNIALHRLKYTGNIKSLEKQTYEILIKENVIKRVYNK